jgi:probable rRNA maturation factor
VIEIVKSVKGITEAPLLRFLRAARKAAGLRGDVSVLLTSNREMQRLNRVFRGKDKPTDVLSFPAIAEVNRKFAGDIAISLDIASRNAKQLGHHLEAETKILILHGLLHLAGYDHETDNGEMARRESRLRSRLGLPLSLIERNHEPKLTKKTKPRSSSGRRQAR